jgi:hypothetical protein
MPIRRFLDCADAVLSSADDLEADLRTLNDRLQTLAEAARQALSAPLPPEVQ